MDSVGAQVGMVIAGSIGMAVVIFGGIASGKAAGQFFPEGSTKQTFAKLGAIVFIFTFFIVGFQFQPNLSLRC